jgi:hypothetical protein
MTNDCSAIAGTATKSCSARANSDQFAIAPAFATAINVSVFSPSRAIIGPILIADPARH